jgi:hypothetical protein
MTAKVYRPAGQPGGGQMSTGRRVIYGDDIPVSPARQILANLLEQAQRLAETDPSTERRARHRQIVQWLTYRIARAIMREAGR